MMLKIEMLVTLVTLEQLLSVCEVLWEMPKIVMALTKCSVKAVMEL